METITNARRAQIKDIVLGVLSTSEISSLPVMVNKILKSHHIRCFSFKKMSQLGFNVDYGKSGDIIVDADNRYVIIYNESHSEQRIRWTIAHELGHIMLNHFRGVCVDKNKEAAANYFARELLLPLAVLGTLGARSAEDIARVCNVSLEADQIRTDAFKRRDEFKAKYGNTKHDLKFLACFNKMFENEFAAALAV